MMSGEQRRLAAVMFTDIVGYSSLTQKDERLAVEVLEEHRKIIRPIVARYNGREIKTMGDAFLLDFGSALEAAQCAIDVQKKLHDYNQQSIVERRVHIRIGIHLGDILQRESDVLGDTVNIASRIEALAEPDGICISQQTFDQVRNKLDCPIENLGPRQLKNIDYPIDVHKILWMKNVHRTLLDKNESASVSLDRKRIAVLPFLNISPDPNDEYFADGLTEELIARLSSISGLKVIARTSIMRFRGTSKSVGEIGKELRAGTILEGSVRKAANKLRVTAQLIDASSEEHLWVENYDRQLEDIFAIQTEVANNVADALKTRLLKEEKELLKKKPTKNMVAYTLYLKGRHCWNERSKDSLTKAVKYFEEAVERDPMFALAYSGLADSYCVLTDHGYLPANEGYAKAKNAAKKALQLDDALAEAHTSLGAVLFHEWDWHGTEAEFAQALKASPNYATAHQWYSLYLAGLGRLDEAIEQAKIAEELDPLSAIIHACLGGHFYAARKYDASIEEFNKALELEPNFAPAYGQRYYVYLMKSMFNEALADLRQWLPGLSPSMAATMEFQHQCYVYAVSGMPEKAKLIIRECEEKVARERDEALDRGVIANFIVIHFKLGDKNRAFEWLAKFFEMRMLTSSEVKCDPFFTEITSDPRFEELNRKTLRSLEAT